MIIPLNADPIPLPSTSEIATGHILHARSRHYYQYIVSRRIERAQTLLLHSDLSVTDICFSVGFESLGSFS